MQITLPSGTKAVIEKSVSDRGGTGLVIIPDVMGLRPLFFDMAKHLASEWDINVCSFELYPELEHLNVEERLEAASRLEDSRVVGDAIEAADALQSEKVAILGFCMGGMYTLKAVSSQRFSKHCSFYGMIRVPEAWKSEGHSEPISCLQKGNAESVLAIVGSDDTWTPKEDVNLLSSTGVTVVSYEGADHGFVHDSSRPAHRPLDAADAWMKAKDWVLGDS
ncbi:MAG TPA: dienelactone hydrolase family protein [Acidimicrobiales bacterium]|nr:dienelactone hydrolase family protein [Acidimicrobiales bacterium]HJM37641.1 dienelactone hydrolase family protein [Acidimicrobiales bacterium]